MTEVAVDRDLVLLDLVAAPGVHGLELADIVQPPNLRAALTTPKGLTYPRTQALAGQWMATNAAAEFPVPSGKADGILYVSRFAPAQRCIALWEGAASALRWFTPSPLGSHPDLESSLALIGIGLLD